MENAKQSVQESQSRMESTGQTMDVESLKIQINTMLHTWLPGDLTLTETEALAITIFDMVRNPSAYLKPRA